MHSNVLQHPARRPRKKLEAAARRWAAGGSSRSGAEELAKFGLSDEEIAEALDGADDGTVEVWPENEPTVALFVACSTQWRIIAGAAGLVYGGLDYPGVEAAARMRGQAMSAELFEGLRVMEAAAMAELNSRKP